MHRVSPWVASLPADDKRAKSLLTISTSRSGESNSELSGTVPQARHTNTVSTIEETVP